MKNSFKATVIGSCAVCLWGMLALLTTLSGAIPPFQLTSMTFMLAFIVSIIYFIKVGTPFEVFFQSPLVWLNGIIGLFGYHALYFMAMQKAPAIEVSLIAYLWPLLIVIFSGFLPGEKLHWNHVVGVSLGFIGVIILLLKNDVLNLSLEYTTGYILAVFCALIWSLYSVICKKNKEVPTMLIGALCGITSVLALIVHLLFEKTVIPQGGEWFAIIALGFGPVGLAFFAWDYGVKNGNIKLLGALAYLAPLVSSFLLIFFGKAELSWQILIACCFIIGGSIISSIRN